MRPRVGLLLFSHTDLRENGSIELDGSDDQVRETWRVVEGKRGEGRVCVMLSENEEPTTGPRAGFNGLLVYVRTYVFERERGEGIDAWPKDDKSFFRLIVLPPFESFDLAAIAVTWTERAVSVSRFRFLGNWSVRYVCVIGSKNPCQIWLPPDLYFAL
ncbi:unnamed protein product [Lasius platythorax]|uniref:Uncharacterized protein n=1 Tax=Lasius platythorax TaxID=488582 RepID=A0AAV2NA66_9HYME